LGVFFTYPGNRDAYNEIAFNQAQLKTLAQSNVKDPKILNSIKVFVSDSAKKLEVPQVAGIRTGATETAPSRSNQEETPLVWGVPNRFPQTPIANKLGGLLPGANPVYLEKLGQAFQQSRIPLPEIEILRLERFRIALHLLAMAQNGQEIKPFLHAYRAMNNIVSTASAEESMNQLRSLEQSLQLTPWRLPDKALLISNELRMLRWPRFR